MRNLLLICELLACLACLFPTCDAFLDAVVSNAGPASTRAKRAQTSSLLVRPRPADADMQKHLVDEHNHYRSLVPATNMRYMFWDESLARSAQRHANRCDFRHSRDRHRTGENIWAAPFADYSDAVRLWYQEVHDASCHCPHSYKHCCGHYVQVVWAQTYKLGCGAAQCRDIWGVRGRGHRNILVCHYSPQGNVVKVNGGGWNALPAFRWQDAKAGRGPCSECPSSARKCFNGKLCY